MWTLDPGPPLTVVAALAEAEAWNERGALLSMLAFELTELVDSSDGRVPQLLVRRLIGGQGPANPRLVESIRRELFAASERAKEKAREFLAATAVLSSRSVVLDFEGHSIVEPTIDYDAVAVPERSYEVVANPAHSSAEFDRPSDGTGTDAADGAEDGVEDD